MREKEKAFFVAADVVQECLEGKRVNGDDVYNNNSHMS